MSTIWTPGGERPVPPRPAEQPAGAPPGADRGAVPGGEPSPEELDALLEQVARTPSSMVVADHCMSLLALADLHMILKPPQFSEAKLAIDAVAAVLEGLSGRLGDAEPQLKQALTGQQLSFVKLRSTHAGGAAAGGSAGGGSGDARTTDAGGSG